MSWHERIIRAEARGFFLQEDIVAAANWADCACAGKPKDIGLKRLGGDFFLAVFCHNFYIARQILQRIKEHGRNKTSGKPDTCRPGRMQNRGSHGHGEQAFSA